MITDETRRRALVARHHLGGTGADVLGVARDLVAVHSSDPGTPHLAMAARIPGYRAADLEAAQPDALWRLHAMRRTLWIAPTEHVGMLDASVGRKIAARERKQLLGWIGRDDGEAWLAGLAAQVLERVAERPGVFTRELSSEVPELATRVMMGSGRWAQEMAVGPKLLFLMALDLQLARTNTAGTWRASQYGWCLPPRVQQVDPERARRLLVERYLERFAPVTTVDLRWWTGMTASAVKKALAQLEAVEVALEDGVGWMLPGQALPAGDGVALLPGLDPTPMGYKERAWYLGPHERPLFDRNGNIGPTIWVDGRIVGGWAVASGGRVVTRLLEPTDERRIAEQVERIESWLEGDVPTPRFRTPLEKELSS